MIFLFLHSPNTKAQKVDWNLTSFTRILHWQSKVDKFKRHRMKMWSQKKASRYFICVHRHSVHNFYLSRPHLMDDTRQINTSTNENWRIRTHSHTMKWNSEKKKRISIDCIKPSCRDCAEIDSIRIAWTKLQSATQQKWQFNKKRDAMNDFNVSCCCLPKNPCEKWN